MKKETLVALGLTDEQIAEVMKENGKDIEKAKSTVDTTLQEEINKRDKQLEELKKADKSAELQQKIEELQKENLSYDAKVKQIKKDALLDTTLIKSNVVNLKAVKALLDAEKISLDGENLIGINEQLEKLKETESWAFKTNEPVTTGNILPKGGGTEKTIDDMLSEQLFGAK